jgi:hypothetical protein
VPPQTVEKGGAGPAGVENVLDDQDIAADQIEPVEAAQRDRSR